MSVEYDGVAYDFSDKPKVKFDPAYPDKTQPYVRPGIDCVVHNYLNGWKCINCGDIKNK